MKHLIVVLIFVFGRIFARRLDELSLIIRPHLDRLSLLSVVIVSVSCASVWVESVSIRVHVVPGS